MAEANGDVPQTNGSHPAASPPSQPTTAPTASQTAPVAASNPAFPLTSLHDDGLSKRPRDARLLHTLISSLGCVAYQERVLVMIKDSAYRHLHAILSDTLHLSSDAYISQQTRARDPQPGGAFKDADGQVSLQAVQLAISSRLQYQFSGGSSGGGMSKEFLLEMAQNRNKVALPRVLQNEWGVRLPSERFVLSGVPWGLRGEWVTEEEAPSATAEASAEDGGGDSMEGVLNYGQQQDGDEGDEEGGTMEDLFGNQADEPMETAP